MWLDLLSSLGFGEQITVAALFAMIGWYIIRGKSALGTIVGIFGTIGTVAVGVVVVLAMSVALGWFDPSPGVFLADASTALEWLLEHAGDIAFGWLEGAVS